MRIHIVSTMYNNIKEICQYFCFIAVKELKLKDEECEKLSRVRNELEAELEELTASLFQVC